MQIKKLTQIGINALLASKLIHDKLEENGLLKVKALTPNRFGETTLKGDLEAENAIITVLKKAKLPIRIVSEEHGTLDLSNNPKFLGIIDGIDGTSLYIEGRNKLRYATMFGIASSTNPLYSDYLFSGIMEHSTNRLWYAVKDKGSFMIDLSSKQKISLIPSTKKVFDENCRIYTILTYNVVTQKLFAPFFKNLEFKLPLSAAISYVDIASGEAELEAEVTRKNNLEQMIAFGLLKEAGCVMVDEKGQDIGPQKYLEFGQKTSIPLFTACTNSLAQDFLKKLKKNNN